MSDSFVAVDLGASSGRVMLGRIDRSTVGVALTEVHRFANGPEPIDGGLRWNIDDIYLNVLSGLRSAASASPRSIAIDSWAVDYGLIDGEGKLDGDVRCYRDPRTDGMAAWLREHVDDRFLYRTTGLQYLPFNTIYQLLAEPPHRLVDHTLLLVPDLLGYRLTGAVGAEVTNASTTALLDATSRRWSLELAARAGIPRTLLPPLRQPGERVGPLRDAVAARTGLAGVDVCAVASHDTASAVAAVPAASDRFAYVSCGTWSLVGLELDAPVLTEPARLANFTNEAGVDGTVRFLRNTMGLWLLSESVRTWRDRGRDVELGGLLRAAGREPAFAAIVDPDDPRFLAPGDMPARIADACRRTGQPVPERPAAVVRTVLESLAIAHAAALHTAVELAGRPVDVVHLVGGGSRNEPLCQFTADACGVPVLAGPVEASALGNVLIQARAAGRLTDRERARALVRAGESLTRYEPGADRSAWRHAAARLGIELPG